MNCEIAQYKGEYENEHGRVDNLEAEMKRKKISILDIAKFLGVSYRTIHGLCIFT